MQTWFGSILCGMGRHKFKELAYGYPPFKKTWCIIETCERCGQWRRTWDDLFVERRPKKWAIERDCMTYRMPVPRSAAPWAPANCIAAVNAGPIQK